MTGYEEAMTDPSYAGQILTFTYPLIGNYGVSRTVSQHPHATVAGCVIKHISHRPSHFENVIDLGSWLEEQQVPTIVGVDTRALTIALREHGTIAAALAVGDDAVVENRCDARRVRAHGNDAADSSPASRTPTASARRSAAATRTSCCSTAASNARSFANSRNSTRA